MFEIILIHNITSPLIKIEIQFKIKFLSLFQKYILNEFINIF